MISYAQNFEDVYIFRAFKDLNTGFYIDIGAYDPDEDSVTKLFYDRGWNGVNVEPGPSFDRFEVERPRDTNLRVAVSDMAGRKRFFYHEGDPGTSTLKSNLHAQLVGRVGERREIDVDAVTLSDLLTTYGADRTIQFLKIDIEGMEAPVVASVDWRTHRPELILTEATRPYTNNRIDKSWTPILRKAGYELVFFDGINTYYLREESRSRKGAFLSPVNVLDGFTKYDPRVASMERQLAMMNEGRTVSASRVTSLSQTRNNSGRVGGRASETRPALIGSTVVNLQHAQNGGSDRGAAVRSSGSDHVLHPPRMDQSPQNSSC